MLKFTEQQELLRKVVRDFVESEIAPIAQKIDEEDTCPVELFKKMGDLGFNGVFVPEIYGGTGLGYTELAIIAEEIARYAAGFSMGLVAHTMAVYAIMTWGSEEQKQKYLPRLCSGSFGALSVTEPGGGSDFMGQKSTGRLVENDWVLNGRKCFITNSHCMEVNVVSVRTGEDSKGRPQLSVFIVEGDTPGQTPGRKEKKAGLRGSFTGDINLDNVRVPQDSLLGKPGDGAKIGLGTLGEMGRGGTASVALGILRGCLEESVKFAKERVIYAKPLSNLPNIQFIIAENRTDYEAARLLTYNATGLKDAGKPCFSEYAMAKFFATEAAVRAAKRTIDLMGGYGVITDYPVSRYLRDAVTMIPACGTSHVMQVIIAGGELKK
ncbi:acyl-CoA dehydrogenase family protein [Pelotomaculum propionicicum]|uniref:Acyl-CoA dehydrogenase n=1 Tax=Pelotomaculum propionicicum TaxID=258475 RepID=A0A4Y7RVA9_9FIRM|nr:acyl-CoA dehydrogenase family protein [Pelotomaculum propionicicum]NLI14062.1 acyl-CoA dehydrogenase [Peptococcaceae bacterium]TEB12948.1 Acyl-CoA dehydrogenase [Pelotomaculum propionicicum]